MISSPNCQDLKFMPNVRIPCPIHNFLKRKNKNKRQNDGKGNPWILKAGYNYRSSSSTWRLLAETQNNKKSKMGKNRAKKVKRAWRNISTKEFDDYNEKATRDANSGGSLASAPSDSLFVVDKSTGIFLFPLIIFLILI